MKNIRIFSLLLVIVLTFIACTGCTGLIPNNELEDRVNGLDEQLQIHGEALNGISASLEAINESLQNSTVQSEIDANKQNIADILAAIEKLEESIKAEEEKAEEEAVETENVKAAVAEASAKIDTLKAAFEADKAHYTAEAVVAIRGIFGEANVALATCTSAHDAAVALDKLQIALGEYDRVDNTLYNYVVELTGNISDETEDLVEEAKAALKAAKKFYATNLSAITKYKISDRKTINLIEEIEDLCWIQETVYPAAVKDAKAINKTIAKFKPLQQTSIAKIVTKIGGYYKVSGDRLVAVTDTELENLIDGGADIDTIALFVTKYGEFGFEDMIDMDAYDDAIEAVEENIEKMADVLDAFLVKYEEVLDEEDEFEVTVDNLDVVYALEEFLDAWTMIGRTDFSVATYKNSYIVLESILADFDMTAADLNDMIDVVEGWIENAEDITTTKDTAITLYNLVNELYAIDKTTYDFTNLEPVDSLTVVGIVSLDYTTKTVNRVTKTTWKVEYVTINEDGEYVIETESIEYDGEEEEFVEYFLANYDVISAVELLETALEVEAYFAETYNDGDAYAPITKARSGWLTENNTKGFGYVRYVTYEKLVSFGELADKDIEALEKAKTYDELRSVVYAIYGRTADTSNWTEISIGDLVIYDCE